ncbi:uncharacterized protein LOC135962445 [Calliphora vicina]|uniref:uncharacterized protein LOC135962445 n=1 Tax=Calliphora vicina TaxID=7373 RepID=UPI00325BCD0E
MIRLLTNNLRQKWPKISTRLTLQNRKFNAKTPVVIGGGLEKPQGGLKEEKYFCNQNNDLIAKLREQGTTLKCENCISDWKEFEKVLRASDDRTALRETCALNKHKNCLEEAFFLNEQNECYTKLCKEIKTIQETNIEQSPNIQKLKKFESEDEIDSNM